MVGARSRVVAGVVACLLLVVGVAVAVAPAGAKSGIAVWRELGAKEAGFPRKAQCCTAVSTDSGLVGVGTVDGHGTAWTSSDGRSWSGTPLPGARGAQLGALVEFRGELLTASSFASDDVAARVWRSRDGHAWATVRTDAFGPGDSVYSLAVDRGGVRVVAVGTGERDGDGQARAWTSDDGRHWSRVALPETLQSLASLVVVRTGFVALGYSKDAAGVRVWRSSTGQQWSQVETDVPPRLGSLAASRDGRRILGIQYETQDSFGGRLWSSSDGGVTWTEITSFAESFRNGSPDHITQMAWGWLLSGNKGTADGQRRRDLWWTPDLEHWQELPVRLQGDVGGGHGTPAVAHHGSAIAFGIWADRKLWTVTPVPARGRVLEQASPEPRYEPTGIQRYPTAESIAAKGPEWASVATGCSLLPGSSAGWSNGDGTTNFDRVPRWIPVIVDRVARGCTPRELLFPDLDGGAALRELTTRAFGTAATGVDPPLPVFAPDGTLVAWSAGRGIPRAEAESSGSFAPGLLANPPTAAQYEQNPK